ncbi:MAG: hypothetical protein ACRC5H_05710 [Treponemataceae bacterium]
MVRSKKLYGCFLFFCFFSFVLFANESTRIFKNFEKAGLKPTIQVLSSDSKLFPYNIFLNFGEQSEQDLYVVILQEEADYFFDTIVRLANTFKKNPPSFGVHIVLIANASPILPDTVEIYTISGIQKFISSINRANVHAVLLLNQSEHEKIEIIPASFTKFTPLWLLESVEKSTFDDYLIPTYSLLLYRLGILGKDLLYNKFLQDEIPTLLINTQNTLIENLLLGSVQKFEKGMSRDWDNHYSFFYFGEYLYIPESATLLVILISIAVLLFFLFMFSFLFGDSKYQRIQDLKQTWYIIPLMIFGIGFLLFLSQSLGKIIFPLWENQVIFAGILKIAITIIFFASLTFLQRWVKFPEGEYIYGYLLILIALLNIIIFSSFSLSFFYNFLLVFAVSYFIMITKPFLLKLILSVIMTLPLAYFLFYADSQTIRSTILFFITLPFWGNILFACMILPYEIVWIMVLVRFKLFGKKEIIGFPYIITSACFISFIVTISIFFYQFTLNRSSLKETTVINRSLESSLTVKIHESTSYDKSHISFEIASKIPALRYIIVATTTDGVSIYDANFPYEISTDYLEGIFLLDDNPPQILGVNYSSDLEGDKDLKITAYYGDAQTQHFYYETKSFFIKGQNVQFE